MQTQFSPVLYKCSLLHGATLCLVTSAPMITGVICVIIVTMLIITAASIDWLFQGLHWAIKNIISFHPHNDKRGGTLLNPFHRWVNTGYKEFRLSDMLSGHTESLKWVFEARTEFKGPRLHYKLLVLSLFMFSCIPEGGHESNTHPRLSPLTAHLPSQAVSLSLHCNMCLPL